MENAYGPVRGIVATRSATGTKSDTPLIETPGTINVVTRQQMDDQKVETVNEALRYVPGIVAEPRGTSNVIDFIYSRGFAIDQYQDGLRLLGGPWGNAQIDPYLLERVEVLKGPPSVLYGQASPGGLLNLVSKRPNENQINQVEIQGGSYDRIRGAFDVGGKIDKDAMWLYRVVGTARDNGLQTDFGKQQRFTIAPSLTFRPTKDTNWTVLVSHQADPYGGTYNFVPARGTVLPNINGIQLHSNFYTGEPSYDRFERYSTAVTSLFEHKFNDAVTFTSNARYNHIDTKFDNVFLNTLSANQQTLNRYTWHDKERLDAYTLDNRVQVKLATGPLDHTVVLGTDYQEREYDQLLGSNFSGPPTGSPPLSLLNPIYFQNIPPIPFSSDTVNTVKQAGVYVQDQIKVDRLVLVGGVRKDFARINTATTTISTGAITSSSQYDEALTGRGGFVYLFDSGFAPFYSYSQSFQPTSGVDFFRNAFKPTTGEGHEAGVKYQPKGWNSFLQATMFNLVQQNVTTPDPAHPGSSVQEGEVRSRGVELSAVADFTNGWKLIGSYSYLDQIVTRANPNTSGVSTLGKRLTAIPRNQVSGWVDYTFQPGHVLAGLSLAAGVRYIGETVGDSANTYEVPAYAVVDAALRYDLRYASPTLKGYDVAINATNLFDKEYISYCGALTNCTFGFRRMVLGTLRYRWQ